MVIFHKDKSESSQKLGVCEGREATPAHLPPGVLRLDFGNHHIELIPWKCNKHLFCASVWI